MNERTDYEYMVDEILDAKTEPKIIPALIDDYANKSSDNKLIFFITLMRSLSERMVYSRRLRKLQDDTIIRAGIEGELLYLNTRSKEWQIFIIIGESNFDVEQIIIDFNALMQGKTKTVRKALFEDFKNDLPPNTELILRNPFYNLLDFHISNFKAKVGDRVKKNEVLGIMEHLTLSTSFAIENDRYQAAKSYCSTKIDTLAPSVNKKKQITNDPPKETPFLKDIFLSKEKHKYDKIIEKLAENHYDEFPSPFIKITGDKTEWEVGISHSYSYLAGLIGALRELKLIYDKKEGEFIEIAKKTFLITIKSRTAFQKMKSGNLDDAFISPFRQIFKNIK